MPWKSEHPGAQAERPYTVQLQACLSPRIFRGDLFLSRRSLPTPQSRECRPTAMHTAVLPRPTAPGSTTYSLTDRSSCRTLRPSPSHPRTGSGSSASLEARQVGRVSGNAPVPGCTAPSRSPGPGPRVDGPAPFAGARAQGQGRSPAALRPPARPLRGHPRTRRGGRRGPSRPAAGVTVLHQRCLAGSRQPLQPARHRHGGRAPSPRQRGRFRPPTGSTSRRSGLGRGPGPQVRAAPGPNSLPRSPAARRTSPSSGLGPRGARAAPPLVHGGLGPPAAPLLRPGRGGLPSSSPGPHHPPPAPVSGPAPRFQGICFLPPRFWCRYSRGKAGWWR